MGIFLGESINDKAYRVYNIHTKTTMESINVVINDNPEEKDVFKDEDDVSPQQKDVPTDIPLRSHTFVPKT